MLFNLPMKNFIVLLREPDGRRDAHQENEIKTHQLNWKNWLTKYQQEGKLVGGSSLTLKGNLIKGNDAKVTKGLHEVGTEIVGGFLLLKAEDLNEATAIAQTCPIYEFDGYAEVREFKQQ